MKLLCTKCDSTKALDEKDWRCTCGGPLTLDFESRFPLEKIKTRPWTLWRYREALPIEDDGNIVSLGEACTPLVNFKIDRREVLLKLDYLFPTGSYKDRGTAVMMSRIHELGISRVIEDSSGNAGASVAAYAARAGIIAEIYVPEAVSSGKLMQISAYGANVVKVPGDRQHTAEKAHKTAEKCYYASHVWNPFFLHGTKTFAFELAEQLGWQAPDSLYIPVGNGTLLLGAWIGFNELHARGVIDSMPRLIGVQSAHCAPLYALFHSRPDSRTAMTIADGIAISDPPRIDEIVRAVEDSGGDIVTVKETEIISALQMLARGGYIVEPTSAVALAGFLKSGKATGRTAIPLTGHGLKAIDKLNYSVDG